MPLGNVLASIHGGLFGNLVLEVRLRQAWPRQALEGPWLRWSLVKELASWCKACKILWVQIRRQAVKQGDGEDFGLQCYVLLT